ncbi:hypothetical protein PMIN07_005586 [Paraphaeosphaeria minitans]
MGPWAMSLLPTSPHSLLVTADASWSAIAIAMAISGPTEHHRKTQSEGTRHPQEKAHRTQEKAHRTQAKAHRTPRNKTSTPNKTAPALHMASQIVVSALPSGGPFPRRSRFNLGIANSSASSRPSRLANLLIIRRTH